MSVAAIFERIRQEAESSQNPGTMALFLARYYGFHPRVTRMVELVVGQQEGQDPCRHVCVMLLVNEESNMYSPFWCAVANLYLGLLQNGLTPKSRDEYFAAAEGNLWRVAIDRDGVDAAYIQRRIRVAKLDDAPTAEVPPCGRHKKLIDEMINAGDFDTPGAFQRFFAETYPGDGYVEPGPWTLNFVTSYLARVDRPDCYYSKVQMAALQEYVKKKFGV